MTYLSLPSRRCPRCKATRAPTLFEGHVAICLICYARVEGNQGLSLDGLRAKARQSPRGLRRARANERAKVEALFTSVATLEEEQILPCSECKANFSSSDLVGGVCEECRSESGT